jgi:hypothetical protein
MPTVQMPVFKDGNNILRVVLDPKIPVTPYICFECWSILDDETAYCRRCGVAGTSFGYREVAGQMCFCHPGKSASQFCNYCGRSFCDNCLKTNEGSILSMGTYTYHCILCLGEMERVKRQHSNRDKSFCLRHPDVVIKDRCSECPEQVCEFCTYLPVVGLFRRRVVYKPYCFMCIRTMIWDHKIRRATIRYFAESKNPDQLAF